MQLIHDLNRYIELRRPSVETPLWRYVYGGRPKPFFHPLCTPAGHVLTLTEPSDHVWHRGLWFTIKFVNGENFWEEKTNTPWGDQKTLNPPTITHVADGSIAVVSKQNWVRPNGETIIDEDRSFTYVPIDQDSYAMDFSFSLTPRAEVLLDRTPFTTWGGYGGLTFRGSRNWIKTKLLFDDGTTSDRPTPKHSKWCDLTGPIDGGRESIAGVATFDHPTNLRHPTPWYGGTGIGHYYCAAFLFHEPYKLAAGQNLTLKYRTLVHDNAIDVDRMNELYADWAGK
ncbi:MAG: PmoA family protein [Burkholderiales bacterium]|nr:PmoA family protein [Phycisphaerae bacterium]